MPVRLAQRDDVPAILAISNAAAVATAANFAVEPETLDAWEASYDATHATHPWYVADDDDGAVVAFAKASPWKGRCAYDHSVEITVYVDPAHHRRGLGRALYDALLDTLRRQGYHAVLAGITLPNDASVRLHESFGLKPAARFERIGWKFGRWHDVGYWLGHLREPDAPPEGVRAVAEVVAPS